MNQNIKTSLRQNLFNLVYVAVLAIGILFLVESGKLLMLPGKIEVLGMGGWAFIMSSIWVTIIIILIIYGTVKRETVPSYKINIYDGGTIRWVLIVLMTLLYVLVVRRLDFIITSLIYQYVLIVCFSAFRKRDFVLAALVSIMTTLLIYYSYTLLFKVPLPGML